MMVRHAKIARPTSPLPLALACENQMQTKQIAPPTIHVWRISLASCPARDGHLASALTPDEQARAARFRVPAHRARWVRTRGVVRALLGQYLHCPPFQVPLSYGRHGKPMLAPGFRAVPLHFNWSHTDDLALLALTDTGPVGIDLERVRADFDPLMLGASVFSPDEMACLNDTRAGERRALFFRLWTGREALLKALGTGFAAPSAGFCLAGLARQGAAQAHGLTVHLLPAPGGHAAALACLGGNPQIYERDWHD